MTKEEIIRLAESAGITVIGEAVWRLCEVVAAAEREACAEICDRIASLWPGESLEGWHEGYVDGAGACRNLIRERGEK